MMATNTKSEKYVFISLIAHVGILLVFLLGYEATTPMAVVENTNKNDVISAVVLGDTEKSKSCQYWRRLHRHHLLLRL